ncbi:MAG: hypothetical protein ABIP54_03375, partial [Candidatus Andersenbacteria bacterium]
AGIDYLRIPFVYAFGYTTLELRAVMFLASALFFITSVYLLIKFLGKDQSIVPLIFLTFSPIYLSQQRLGWAVTLLPLFAVLLVFALQSNWKHKYLLAGLIAGLGLANHLLFLPTLVAIIVLAVIVAVIPALAVPRVAGKRSGEPADPAYAKASAGRQVRDDTRSRLKTLFSAWPIIIGFIAGFSMQFAILQLYPDDQGSQRVIAETFSDRLSAFPSLFSEIVSGSSYIASYTGKELSGFAMTSITGILSIFAIIALLFSKHKKIAWLIAVALVIHLFVLLRIIDRFSLRYMTTFVLGFWLLSGIGMEAIVALIRKRFSMLIYVISGALCTLLVLWAIFSIVIPYVRTGGSTSLFSLGNRTDSASALVDTRGLFACVKNLGPVTSENVHIYNRLEFWSKQYSEVQFVNEDHKKMAKYVVDYRIAGNAKSDVPGTICPELTNFKIVKNY